MSDVARSRERLQGIRRRAFSGATSDTDVGWLIEELERRLQEVEHLQGRIG